MKEITRIITAEITCIEKVTDEECNDILSRVEDTEQHLADLFKQNFFADDVHVKIQDFIAEKGE